ncbi:MAG: helix-turn-helix transcriptional regulator [Streptomycetaceae bacterium]|nr:helix-turn-helix transcriptional regulator [Streptomycetaceae bacterium]
MWAHSWALTQSAPLSAADGRLDDALAALELAEELANRCGAARLLSETRECRTRLTEPTAGGSPSLLPPLPLPEPDGLDQLTSREREVAALAGQGITTREIAEELNLSPRTVDVHLTRIYRKLGIKSRAALALLVGRLDAHHRGLGPATAGTAKG